MSLVVLHCPRCQIYQHHPRPACLGCGGDLRSVEAAGTGTVDSFTVVHRPDEEPYILARVRLTEGLIVLTHLIGIADPRCDQPVRLIRHEGAAVFTSFTPE